MVPVKARSRLNKVLVSRFPLAVPLSAAVLLIFLACTSNSYGGVGYIVLEPFEQERGPQSMRRVTHHQTKPLSMHDDISSSLSYVNSFKKLGRSLTFLHIPKTAGTAIELAAGRSRVSWGSCLFKHRPKRKICHYPGGEEWPHHLGWWHLPSQLFPLANTNPYINTELFGVIRNPYERMVSEFYYICTLQVFYWRPDQCDRSKLFDAQYMNEWLSHKLNDRQRASAVRYMTDNGHFTPQYEFIFAPHEVRMLDYVLKMDGETLSEDFHKLMRAFGHDKVKLKKTNSLGAAARSDSKTRLDVDHLNVGALLSIHAMYPHDVSLGNYPLRRLMH